MMTTIFRWNRAVDKHNNDIKATTMHQMTRCSRNVFFNLPSFRLCLNVHKPCTASLRGVRPDRTTDVMFLPLFRMTRKVSRLYNSQCADFDRYGNTLFFLIHFQGVYCRIPAHFLNRYITRIHWYIFTSDHSSKGAVRGASRPILVFVI